MNTNYQTDTFTTTINKLLRYVNTIIFQFLFYEACVINKRLLIQRRMIKYFDDNCN